MADNPIDRRRFFRRGLQELLKPLAEAIAPLEHAANHLGSMEQQLAAKAQAASATSAKPPPKTVPLPTMKWLRPPGALDEAGLAGTCTKSGECVKVCPAECIAIDETGRLGGGLPYINVNAMPCVVCDGLYCMHACPTGALIPTPLADIDMGTAVWNESICQRSKEQDCTICVNDCPIGSVAIELIDGKVWVHETGCIGCGVCQNHCPTTPKSIVVIPRASA